LEWRYLWSQTRPDEHQVFWKGTNLLGQSLSARWAVARVGDGGSNSRAGRSFRNTILRQEGGQLPRFANHAPLLASPKVNRPPMTRLCCGYGQSPRKASVAATGSGLEHGIHTGRSHHAGHVGAGTLPGLVLAHIPLGFFPCGVEYRKRKPALATARRAAGGCTSPTLAVSPDGSLFAVALSHGRFRIHNTADGRETLTVKATPEFVTTLAFAPDGTAIVSGAGYTDTALQIWTFAPARIVARWRTSQLVSSLTFTRDGRQLISSSADQTIRLWDWSRRAGRRLARARLHGE